MTQSRDILSRLSPQGAAVVEGPGTLRDKWWRLSAEDREVLVEAAAAAENELKKIQEVLERSGLATKKESAN